MSLNLKFRDFRLKYGNSTLSKLRNPRVFSSEDILLPIGTLIHFNGDADNELGISQTNVLIRNYLDDVISIYHLDTLIPVSGKVHHMPVRIENLTKPYHKVNLRMKRLKVLSKGLGRERTILIMNYVLLPKIYSYVRNNLQSYQEWLNGRATMWHNIAEIGDTRTHFIHLGMPTVLPSKLLLDKYLTNVTPSILNDLIDPDTLNILELWRIVNLITDTPISMLTDDVATTTMFVITNGNKVVFLNLFDLYTWAQEDLENTRRTVYSFLDFMITLGTSVGELDLDMDLDSNVIGQGAIVGRIKELGLAGKLSGAEQKALIKKSNRYSSIKNPFNSEETLEDILSSSVNMDLDEHTVIKPSVTLHDQSMLKSSVEALDTEYINKVYERDIVESILAIQQAGLIVTDFKIKENLNAVTHSVTYSIQIQPINGEVSTIKFTLPKIQPDGSFLVNGVNYRLDKQRGSLPIEKIKPYQVSLTSYYGKSFITRNQNNVNNLQKWISRILLKRFNDTTDSTVSNLIFGIQDFSNINVPRLYSAIGSTINSFHAGNYHFVFDINRENKEHVGIIKDNKLWPCGSKDKNSLAMDDLGFIYMVNEQVTPLGPLTTLIDPTLPDGPIEYSEISIYNKRIPLIIIMMYQFGLNKTLDDLNIKYITVDSATRVKQSSGKYVFKLSDLTYVIDINSPENKLLIGGLSVLRKTSKGYKSSSLNKRAGYFSLLTGLGLGQHHMREILLMFDMFVDPKTLDILKLLELPTDFNGLLNEANVMLIDDSIPDNNTFRIKGYERLPGMIYEELLNSIRSYRVRGNSTGSSLEMNPRALWLKVLQDQSIVLIEDSNPIQNLKEKEAVTFSGHGGRSSESMVKNTRGFNKGDLGIISESSPDSGKVGVRTFLSANANIDNLYGIPRKLNMDTDGPSSLLSTSAMLSAASTHEDAKRVNFISIMNTHNVATAGDMVIPYRTGYEQVIAHRCSELYAIKSKMDGVVKKIDDRALTVTYSDGSEKTWKLGVIHGTVADVTVPHRLISDLSVGAKFKMDDIIAFNTNFFARDTLNKSTVSYKYGNLVRVAFLESVDTIEDGCTISTDLAKTLITPNTGLRNIVLSATSNVHNLVKVGDVVDPDTILCTIEDAVSLDVTKDNSEAINALQQISSNNPKSKYFGRVSKVEILHYPNKDIMSDTVIKLIESDSKRRAKEKKSLKGDIAVTGEISESIHIAGKKLVSGELVIKIYIDGNVPMGVGDKIVFGNQLKATCSRVHEDISSKDGTAIDALFGYKSVANRIVDIERIGIVNTIMVEASKKMLEIYNGN